MSIAFLAISTEKKQTWKVTGGSFRTVSWMNSLLNIFLEEKLLRNNKIYPDDKTASYFYKVMNFKLVDKSR